MPTVHQRHFIMAKAKFAITDAITRAIQEHALTHAELTSILANEIVAWSGWAIRDEREPSQENRPG